MARPRKFYIIFELGKAIRIHEGRPSNYAGRPFKTRIEAEEHAAWWNYHHPTWLATHQVSQTR